MNNKLGFGIWLVFAGAIILLHNLDIIDFNFYAIMKLWPLAIVSVGLSLLLQNRPNGVLISMICNIAICSFLTFKGLTDNETTHKNRISNIDSNEQAQRVAINNEASVESVKLHINGGAAGFKMVKPTDKSKLFAAWTDSPNIRLDLRESGTTNKELFFDAKHDDSRSKKNSIDFSLHSDPLWDLEVNVGAASFKADFSPYRLQNLNINAGASNMSLVFGQPENENTNIEINTGASSVKLEIPDDAAYRVTGKNVISSTKYEGAKKVGNGIYQTPNYNSASKKYDIQLNGAANSISVSTYSFEK